MLDVHCGDCLVQNRLRPELVQVALLLIEVAAARGHAQVVDINALAHRGGFVGFRMGVVAARPEIYLNQRWLMVRRRMISKVFVAG